MSQGAEEGEKEVLRGHTYARNSKIGFCFRKKSKFGVIGVIDVICICFQ
jgi:hypothetical protein